MQETLRVDTCVGLPYAIFGVQITGALLKHLVIMSKSRENGYENALFHHHSWANSYKEWRLGP